MYRFRAFTARFFNKMVKKSKKGKAKLDKSGRSVRQRAFSYFHQGLRPSQLPDLGVPRTTIYRYFQSFKHRDKEVQFRPLKRLLTSETASREKVARQLGVSAEALMEALKGSRSVAQLEKRLRLEDTKQLEHLVEQAGRLDLERLIKGLRRCQSLEKMPQ